MNAYALLPGKLYQLVLYDVKYIFPVYKEPSYTSLMIGYLWKDIPFMFLEMLKKGYYHTPYGYVGWCQILLSDTFGYVLFSLNEEFIELSENVYR